MRDPFRPMGVLEAVDVHVESTKVIVMSDATETASPDDGVCVFPCAPHSCGGNMTPFSYIGQRHETCGTSTH